METEEEANFLSPCQWGFGRPHMQARWEEGEEEPGLELLLLRSPLRKNNTTPGDKSTPLIFSKSSPSLFLLASLLVRKRFQKHSAKSDVTKGAGTSFRFSGSRVVLNGC